MKNYLQNTSNRQTIISRFAKSIFLVLCLTVIFNLTPETAKAQSAPNLRSAAGFVFLSGGNTTTTDTVSATGKIGVDTIVSNTIITDDTVYYDTSSVYIQAIADMDTAMAYIDGVSATSISGTLGGQSLSAGAYSITGATNLYGTLTLTGSNTDIYIFDISDSLLVGHYGTVRLGPVFP